jgi:tripeptidyl-peptidase-1
MKLHIVTLAALAIAGLASALPTDMVIKESVTAPPQWIRRGPAPDTHTVNLQIALKQRAINALEEDLADISDPASANYGKWMTQDQVNSYLQPEVRSVEVIRRWLASNEVTEQISKRSASGDWMNAQVTVAKARELLGGADFAVWEHRTTGEQLIRAIEYRVPKSVSDHIDLIGPTTYFSQVRALNTMGKQSSTLNWEPVSSDYDDLAGTESSHALKTASAASSDAKGVPASCNVSSVSSDCLRQYYHTYTYKVRNPTKQLIGISGFLAQYASFSDLAKFLSTQRPEAAKAKYKFNVVLNGEGAKNDQDDAGVEANLDVQTVAAIGFNIPSTFYSNPGSPPYIPDENTPTNTNEPYTTEFEYLLSLPDSKLPSILSTSYGDDEQTVPLAYQKRVCLEIAALGARGVTVFFSSGDNGVGPDGLCYSNDGKNTRMFLPSFPPSCPYVTAVGATEQFAPEQASGPTAHYYGGGGFSNTWPMPAYQKRAVEPYIKSLGKKYKGLYNPKGR